MTGHGEAILGGVVAGGIRAEIKFDHDNSMWIFKGALVGLELGVQTSFGVMGEFPGYSHIAGICMVGVLGGGLQKQGELIISWRDTQGEIGTVRGRAFGTAISVSGGTGEWVKDSLPANPGPPAPGWDD
jgi:hypothetical protein